MRKKENQESIKVSETPYNASKKIQYLFVILLLSLGLNLASSVTAKGAILPALLRYYSTTGNLYMVKKLVNAGVNINYVNTSYNINTHVTALVAAIRNRNFEIASYLLENGADPNIPDVYGNTALIVAIDIDAPELSFVRLLLNNSVIRVKLDVQNAMGLTALMTAIMRNHNTIAQLLLDAGANPNIISRHELNALWLAIERDNRSLVLRLLVAGADVSCENASHYCTYLVLASKKGNPHIVDMLLSWGADINAQDKNGKTALMNSVEYGHVDVFRKLMSLNPDLDLEDETQQTALNMAVEHSRIEMLQTLLARGANPNRGFYKGDPLIIQAAKHKNKQPFNLLLANQNLNLNIQDTDGNTFGAILLMMAYKDRNLSLFYKLLDVGIDLNITNGKSESVLKQIVYSDGHIHDLSYEDIQFVRALFQYGASSTIRDQYGSKLEVVLVENKCTQSLTKSRSVLLAKKPHIGSFR